MSEGKESSDRSMPVNLTTFLAVAGVVGSIFLVSKKLSSDRPPPPSESHYRRGGDQAVEARLWEDPFKWRAGKAQTDGFQAFEELKRQIQARTQSTGPKPKLLGVMVEGGDYTEDHESRIRSRMAVVSALGESGYAPESAEQIGTALVPWPATADIERWITNANSCFRLTEKKGRASLPAMEELPLSFEWYRKRDFAPGARTNTSAASILVTWLDESRFDGNPREKLALLLLHLTEGTNGSLIADVAIVGPRSSDTLRKMVPAYEPTNCICPTSDQVACGMENMLGKVGLYCATPSAMDAALVHKWRDGQRRAVEEALTNPASGWFKSFHNFCATDEQLAESALEELKLRNIDLTDTQNHLALISERDTFFGRMLSLTYAVKLFESQHAGTNCPTTLDLVGNYMNGSTNVVWPPNLVNFGYLRGLDGQTMKPAGTEKEGKPAEYPSQKPLSLADLKHWAPDVNSAVGEAQFDYLERLGDRLREYDKKLDDSGGGRIRAIGIVGSDVYDTLSILQALRRRFPEAVFFTTDLDARFWAPQEQEWSRNLVVLSGFGLQLGAKFQGQVAPFRDSLQTAQFAATLAALGRAELQKIDLCPRRFEIGRGCAYDLSDVSSNKPPELYPAPPAARGFRVNMQTLRCDWRAILGITLGSIFGCFLASRYWRPLEQLTWGARRSDLAAMRFGAEDMVGLEGALTLRNSTAWNEDGKQQAILRQAWQDYKELVKYRTPSEGKSHLINAKTLKKMAKNAVYEIAFRTLQELFIDFLNDHSDLNESSDEIGRWRYVNDLFNKIRTNGGNTRLVDVLRAAKRARQAGFEMYLHAISRRLRFWRGVVLLFILLIILACLGIYDTYVNPQGEPMDLWAGISIWPTAFLRWLALALSLFLIWHAHDSARLVELEISRRYRLSMENEKRRWWLWRWKSFLSVKEWHEEKKWNPVLKKEIIRKLWKGAWDHVVQFWEAVRYSLPGRSKDKDNSELADNSELDSAPVSQMAVEAEWLWRSYQRFGRGRNRQIRTLSLFCLYFLFGFGFFLYGGMPYAPVRGALAWWIDKVMLFASLGAFLGLTFWVMDGVRVCRWLVERLSEAHTCYPKACLDHFASERSVDPKSGLLEEWIDLQLIAELTDQAGRMVYYPFVVFSILLFSRHWIWDRWGWPAPLVIITVTNLVVVSMSVLMLQRAAHKARRIGIERLRAKVEQAKRSAAPSATLHQADMGRRLLDEIVNLKKGAFLPFWQNPILGAILLPSGGTALAELLGALFG